jgi:septum formation topological specificity factor MinE
MAYTKSNKQMAEDAKKRLEAAVRRLRECSEYQAVEELKKEVVYWQSLEEEEHNNEEVSHG